MSESNKRLRRCMATVFIEPKESLVDMFNACQFIRRWVYQDEIAPTTGRLHAQCYLEFTGAQYFTKVKSWFATNGHQGVHLEPAMGTPAQCVEYCTKEDTRKDGPWQGSQSRTHYYFCDMCDHELAFYMSQPSALSDDHLFDFLADFCDCHLTGDAFRC